MKQLLLAGIAFLLLAISCNQANKKKESQSTITSDIKMEDTIVDSAAFEQSPTLPGEQKQKEPTGKPSQSPESKPDWNKNHDLSAKRAMEAASMYDPNTRGSVDQYSSYGNGKVMRGV